MADWKHHIGAKFSSCRHIANARDPHRERDVRLYHIPGEFDYVGVNDGTDCWICPVAADPFSAGVKRLLEDVRAGKPIELKPHAEWRTVASKPRAVVPPQMELPLAPKTRIRAVVTPPTTTTRKERIRAV